MPARLFDRLRERLLAAESLVGGAARAAYTAAPVPPAVRSDTSEPRVCQSRDRSPPRARLSRTRSCSSVRTFAQMIRHVRPRALALAALLVAAPLPFGSVAPGPATGSCSSRRSPRSPWRCGRRRNPEPNAPCRASSWSRRRRSRRSRSSADCSRCRRRRRSPSLLAPETLRLTQQAHGLAGPAPGNSAEGAGGELRRALARAGGEPLRGARLAPPGRRLPRRRRASARRAGCGARSAARSSSRRRCRW